MRRKDGLLLLGGLVLAAAGVGITAGLQGKGNGSRSSSEDALLSVSSEESREAQSVEERFGIPEAPGYEWIYKDDDSALLPDMSFSDIMELPVYYFTVPENFDLFCENLAKAVLGEDYTVAESVSAPAEEHFVFPEWGNAVYYTLPEEGTARITVSPYGGYYNGQYFYALRSRSEKTERLLEEAEAFLETCQLGFWKNGRSYMQLSETVAGVRAIPVFEGIPAGNYETATLEPQRDGYIYNGMPDIDLVYADGRFYFEYECSGQWEKETALSCEYDSLQEILELIRQDKSKEMEAVNSNPDATSPIYEIFEVEAVECAYIMGRRQEDPAFKASPWIVVTGTSYIYWFGEYQKWDRCDQVYGINLETGAIETLLKTIWNEDR